MLSKEDYKSYLDQLSDIEIKMQKIYKECMDKIDDPSIKSTFENLLYDENRHELIVKALTGIINP